MIKQYQRGFAVLYTLLLLLACLFGMFQGTARKHFTITIGSSLTAPTCSNSDVNTAIGFANTGDTVLVPAGSCTWSSVSINKAITLQGAGVGQTNISMTSTGAFTITKSAAGVTRVTNFSFATSTGGNATHPIIINGSWRSARPIVFQDNAFTTNGAALFRVGMAGGLIIAHNTFTGLWDDEWLQWKDPTDNSGSWAFTDSIGTHDTIGELNHYVENNVFGIGGTNQGTDADDASRVVYRHNFFTNSSFNSHGEDTSSVGVRHYEIYNNEFRNTRDSATTANQNWAVWLRGGTGLIYNNFFTDLAGNFWGNKPEGLENIRGIQDVRPQGACGNLSYPTPHQLGQNNDGTNVTTPPYGSLGSGDFTDPIYWYGNVSQVVGVPNISAGLNGSWGNPCSISFATFFQEGRDAVTTGPTKPGYTALAYPHPLVTYNGGVASCPVTSGGSGYTQGPNISFSGGGGSGASGFTQVTGGAVVAIFVSTSGVNYSSSPTISFSGGGGSGAVAGTCSLTP